MKHIFMEYLWRRCYKSAVSLIPSLLSFPRCLIFVLRPYYSIAPNENSETSESSENSEMLSEFSKFSEVSEFSYSHIGEYENPETSERIWHLKVFMLKLVEVTSPKKLRVFCEYVHFLLRAYLRQFY